MRDYALSALAGALMLLGGLFMFTGLDQTVSGIITVAVVGAVGNMLIHREWNRTLRNIAEDK